MKQPHQFTEVQLSILNAIWDKREATVADVHTAIDPARRLARKTVATMIARLEQQGVLKHRIDGREFVYRALVSREKVQRASIRSMIDKLFAGSAPAFVSYALENAPMGSTDVAEARRLLDGARAKRGRKK